LKHIRRVVAEVRADGGSLGAAQCGVGVRLTDRGTHSVAANALVMDGAVVGAHAGAVVLRAADDEVRQYRSTRDGVVEMRRQPVVLLTAERRAVVVADMNAAVVAEDDRRRARQFVGSRVMV